MKLTDFKALTFDCYGTLIDWESGIATALEPLLARLSARPGRDRLLEAHARHESEQQLATPTMPYRQLLAVVYKRLAEEWDAPASWEECLAYGNSIGNWPGFPDTAPALHYLKQHFKLVILSNVDNQSFALSNRRLEVTFDGVMTAEDIGSYKPAIRNFEYMLGKLSARGIAKGDILHVAESLFHDHGPANQLGLANCWIHRRHAEGGFGATMDPGAKPRFDFHFRSMGELAEAHRKAVEAD